MKTTNLVICAMAVAGFLTATAKPVFQPDVKEYKASAGSFQSKDLPVFYQAGNVFRVAADETMSSGAKSEWRGAEAFPRGIYIAVADSTLGKRLVKSFTLDVPAKKQGYAIYAGEGRVAIVGHDDEGALYGAVTYAQMSSGGICGNARVRDWPDILYRGAPSIGRGIHLLTAGENTREGMVAAYRTGIDWMLRHKLNTFCDNNKITMHSSDAEIKFYREIYEYAQERGIHPVDYGSTALYANSSYKSHPDVYTNWPCIKIHAPWGWDAYYCWADDEATRVAAESYADYIEKLGATKSVLVIHPIDGGSWMDPELWSRRCEKCKSKYGDGERWKASVRQFDIWSDVLHKRLPDAVVGSCIYPYSFGALLAPESFRTPKWKESMPEYWDKLDEGLKDDTFFFSSWIAARETLPELRKLVPDRNFHFSDTYPFSAGIFATYHRKAGLTVYEPGRENLFWVQGTDIRGRWESLFLASEYTWNVNAPGAEMYDGGTYYDPLEDHTGPAAVIDGPLDRICRTFWGEKLAPHMKKIIASGVMPLYIDDPAAMVKYWNVTRRDPLYDPAGGLVHRMAAGVTPSTYAARKPPIADSPEMMLAQVKAAKTIVAETEAMLPMIAGMDRFQRKYFFKFVKNGPKWLAAARAKCCLRYAQKAIRDGNCEKAVALLEKGKEQLRRDFDEAERVAAEFANEPITDEAPHELEYDRSGRKNRLCGMERDILEKAIDDLLASAKVGLKPRQAKGKIRIGVVSGPSQKGALEFFNGFENVETLALDSISLANLDSCDCVYVPSRVYDKKEYFFNLKEFVEKAGGGVYLEGQLCGHARFDTATPFPEIVKTSPDRKENLSRRVKTIDGKERETMYVDYFVLRPGAKGEVRATAMDGSPICVRGKCGIGKVFFNGTVGVESVNGTYDTRSARLNGFNADMAHEAVEYFTGITLVPKASSAR